MLDGTDTTHVALPEELASGSALVRHLVTPNAPAMTVASKSEVSGKHAYRSITDAMFPRWRRLLAGAPGALERKRSSSQARGLFHVTAAALSSALWSKTQLNNTVDRSLAASIEAALVGWQLSHDGDGRPRLRMRRRDSLTAASTYHVVLLLSECAEFRTPLLLSDLAAHLDWLATCSGFPPWVEARVIASLAEGGVLLGDNKWVAVAEARAKQLCDNAGVPGWSGPFAHGDLSVLSASLDPLSRLYSCCHWDFLRPAMIAMAEVLSMVVDRAGAIGGLRNVLRLPFVLPLGVETVAQFGQGYSQPASLSRTAIGRIDARVLLSWGEDLVATVGPSVALCAIETAIVRPERPREPGVSTGWRNDDDGGICVHRSEAYDALVDRRRGGAIRIRWACTGQSHEDHGIRADFDGISLTSESVVDRFAVDADVPAVTVSGLFCVDDGRGFSGLAAAGERVSRAPRAARRWFGLRQRGDCYSREIRFEQTRVIITDSFQLRTRADLVLVGANGLEDHPGTLNEELQPARREDAVVLEDTSGATITRVIEHRGVVRHHVAD